MLLKTKVAIVTGGAQGIGLAISRLFAQEGASVAIAEQNASRGQAAAHEIESADGRAMFVETDVTRSSQVDAMVNATVHSFGGVDILINNAGVDVKKPLLE